MICLLLNLAVAATLRTQNLSVLENRVLLEYDPYRYLRQAELIVEKGDLPEHDSIRYVPLGRDLRQSANFNAYAIAYLYQCLHFFWPSITLTQAAIYYPVLCFLLSLVVFFFLVQVLLDREVALLAVTILAVASPMLQRTMAGFADRDALSLLLALCGFYLYARIRKTASLRTKRSYAILSGSAMGLLGLTWEGSGLLIAVVPLIGLAKLFTDNYTKDDLSVDLCWFTPILISLLALTRTYRDLSPPFAFLALGVPCVFLFIAAISVVLSTKERVAAKISFSPRLPLGLVVTVLLAMVGLPLLLAFGGYGKFLSLIFGLFHHVLYPFGDNRLARTISELQWVFLRHWWAWYGLLLLPLIGGILLSMRNLSISLGLNPSVSLGAMSVLLFGTLVSRLSPNSVLNGETDVSNGMYLGAILVFIIAMLGNSLYHSWKAMGKTQQTRGVDENHLFMLIWFLLTLFCARSGLRFNFFLTPPAVALGSYAIIHLCKRLMTPEKTRVLVFYLVLSVICWEIFTFQDNFLTFVGQFASFSMLDIRFSWRMNLNITLAIIILLMAFGVRGVIQSPIPRRHLRASAWIGVIIFIAAMTGGTPATDGYAKQSYASAKRGSASQIASWQAPLDWMKQNLPESSVIAAWWDYGHWIQTAAKRSTILDNDTFMPYWIHLMARHVFLGQTEQEALEFLKTHGATHLAISSKEVAVLPLISTIGGDENFDRRTAMLALRTKEKETHDGQNASTRRFTNDTGGMPESDLTLDGEVYPQGKWSIREVAVEIETKGDGAVAVKKAVMTLQVNGKTVQLPPEEVYFNGESRWEKEKTVPGTLALFSESAGWRATYLPPTARNSLMVQLYLFGKESDYFRLVYPVEKLVAPASIGNTREKSAELESKGCGGEKSSGSASGGCCGSRSTVKIWEIRYPEGITVNPKYLAMEFPNPRLYQPWRETRRR